MHKLLSDLRQNGGFSVAADDSKPTAGFMVSLPAHETIIPLTLLDDALFSAIYAAYAPKAVNGRYVGAWLDNNSVYFDLSVNVPTLDAALKAGREYSQLAVYDVQKGESVYLPKAD